MRRARFDIAILLFCSAVLLPAALQAQYPKVAKQMPGNLEGEVVSAKGKPVIGAQILWQAADGGTPHVLHSDAHGRFHIPQLRAGLYELRASAGGTWSEWEHNVSVRPGGEATVTLRLSFAMPPTAVPVDLKGTMRTWDAPVAGSEPHDPAADAIGNVWFTLEETGHLARFNPETQEWKLFKVPTPDSGPHGLAADAAGNLWFTENRVGKIGRLEGKTGQIAEYTPPSAKDPDTLAFGPDGALWFTAEASNVIGRVDVVTRKITEYGVPTQNSHPYGIISASDGALWFCELAGGKLARVNPNGGVITEFAPPDPTTRPRRLASVGDAIYFSDFSGGRLGRLAFADKKFQMWDSPSGNDSEPDGIVADLTGKIWYEESAEKANKLVRFDPATEVFRVYAMPANNSSVRNIVRDAHGRLWMSLSMANKITVVE